jgi:hypothetical protein
VGQRTASASFGLIFMSEQCAINRQQDGQL